MRSLAAATLVLAVACSASAQTYSIKPFAGGALPENISGVTASMGNVYGAALDQSGTVFIALADYDIVVRMDAATGVLTRVAGNGTRGFSGDNGPATSAQLSAPVGVAVDAAGNLYIADANNFRVRKVANGIITTVAGNGTQGYSGDGGPATSAQMDVLAGIAIDSSANLYLADFYNQAIRMVANGTISTVAGTGTYGYNGDNIPATSAELSGPTGVAVDAAGNLYIAEAYGNRIRKVAKGTITTVAGNGTAGFSGDTKAATSANLRQPASVAVDTSGNLYIADLGNNRVRKVTAATGIITTVAGNGATTFSGDHVAATSAGLSDPRYVAVDSSGNLYLADGWRIRKIASGTIVTVAGGGTPSGENGPAANAQLLTPEGLAVDSAGNLFIADPGTGRIVKVSGGTLSRIAGGGSQAPTDGIPATSAQLSSPCGVTVDLSGTVYFADSGNASVRKVSGGSLSLVAGSGSSLGDGGPATSAQLSNPQDVAVDAGGNLYVADLNRIRMVSAGVINTAAGNGSAGYQGDGGLATAAEIASPSGIGVDSAGDLLIADTGNNRVRTVAAGIINTVAGNGTYGFSGAGGTATSATLGAPAGVATDSAGNLYIIDAWRVLQVSKGKITTIAGLAAPQGIAVDGAGNVYVAQPSTHQVYVLAPVGAACAVAASWPTATSPAPGATLAVSIQTGTSCPWTVESLPSWITVAGNSFGAGSATVNLVVAANADAPRTATILIGGKSATLAQAGTIAIVGQVTLSPVGTPMPGVTVTLSGAQAGSAVTDSGGNFSFFGLNSAASYTVAPSLAGYAIVPASLTFSNVTSDPTANFVAWPPPQITSLGPGFPSLLQTAPASFAPGEIVSMYGANLCVAPTSASPTLPDRIAACIAQVDGVNLHLYYGSPTQINAVLPQTLATGNHQLVVQRYTDTGYKTLVAASQPLAFSVGKVSMAFVELPGTSLLAVQYLDGGYAGPNRPLHPGDYIGLYLTGLGPKAKTFADGAAPKTTSPAAEQLQILVQGMSVQILYSGCQPQYPGLDQVNFQLPKYTLPTGKTTATFQITAPSTGQVVTYEVSSN